MLNLLKSDIYRIVRGKTLYITVALLLVNTMLLYFAATTSSGIVIVPNDQTVVTQQVYAAELTGVTIGHDLAVSMENFVFFLIPIIVIAAGAIFLFGTVKNDIAWGVSRTKLYFSKLIIILGTSAIMIMIYVGAGIVLATILNGFGGPAPRGHWVELLLIYSAQLVLLSAYIGVGVFLAFTAKRTAAVVGGLFAFVFVPIFLVMILAQINPSLDWLMNFELMFNIMMLARWPSLETYEIVRALALGASFFAASTIGGVMLFRRAEVK